MKEEGSKFFFSYAREDSEFVLRLAKELRKAGASLWLDQLDILGGQRWDEAVQGALTSCQGMLAVLSPSAVASQNFMDEVSYGLEEQKQLIPVRYRECTIPFRLRRVQHVNFVADYEDGFAALLRALKLEPPAVTVVPVETRRVPQQEAARAIEAEREQEPQREAAPDSREARQGEGPSTSKASKAPRDSDRAIGANAEIPRRSLSDRKSAALIGALAGAIIGTIALLSRTTYDKEVWWSGALFVGVLGAIAGAITGTNRKVIIVALAAIVVGSVIGFLILDSNYKVQDTLLQVAPLSAVLGAIVGVILKRAKRWE